ncbi:helix-turn-helix domain-containing protein [Flavivirga rizhaonensis]|uniref:AraC family transcriptional regulator n=1 Tax=Flavivirga rizhaonensis TaxID=2559571 RepID=A0A4V3P5C1_9FLAO|nr:AraC family transcriptional regulator [Flavivirga rizhaonensis]TGV04724.1 AraC family transcriptional regulator [Flavivirga rizhaonensis]
MIKSHETITLFDCPLFTKISLTTPMEETLPLPNEACFVYILKGEGQPLSESENIVAKPEQVILSLCGLTAGSMISKQPKGIIDSIIVHFGKDLLHQVFQGTKPELWEDLETPVTQYVVQSASKSFVKHYFDGVLQLFKNKEALTENILKLKLKEIILLLLQSENAEDIKQITKSLFSERTFTFKELIDAHINTTSSIENLAMVTNCSISTFNRKFKEVYKTTPNAYIVDKKIEKVATLLKVSQDSISNIGYECGFSSPEHLSRAFKKKYSVSPTIYRMNFSVK